jgi:hypothetical protein
MASGSERRMNDVRMKESVSLMFQFKVQALACSEKNSLKAEL